MLVIAMIAGAGIFLIYRATPLLYPLGPHVLSFCKFIQPVALFTMLFLSFCRIEPKQMKPQKWMFWNLMVQCGVFVTLALVLILTRSSGSAFAALVRSNHIPVEAAVLCIICPTASACAVVTGKLGGSMAGVVTYTIMINLLVAVLVPLFVPLIYPDSGIAFGVAMVKILSKVFPLLILPCICAWLVRYMLPTFHHWLTEFTYLSFYIWTFSLTLAIMMSTRAIMNSGCGLGIIGGISLASLICCAFQFWAGKTIGSRYGARISAGQAMGQKNTVFAIWMGYTFLDPVVSVAGGTYSICHNIFNSWQLYRRRKYLESAGN